MMRRIFVFTLFAFGWMTAGPALAADVLKLGAVVSLSGPREDIGRQVLKGYELGVKRLNARGGVVVGNRAYKLEMITADDESSSVAAARAAEKLVRQDRVDFLLGPVTSALVLPVAEVAERYRVPLVQTGAASMSVYEKGFRYNFGILTLAGQYLAGAVDLAANVAIRNRKDPADLKVAMAFLGDGFSQDIRNGVSERIQRWGMTVVVDNHLPDPVVDISDLMESIKEEQPDVLLMSARSQGAALLARQLASTQTYVSMVALTHCDGAGIERMGRMADYLLCASQWDPSSSYKDPVFRSSADFSVDFRLEYGGEEPSYQSAEGAAVILVLADALRRAGSTDRGAVRDALARTDLETFFGPVRFSGDGSNAAKDMVLLQIQGGRYQVVWPEQAATSLFLHPIPKWADRL
ncbi:MAG: amino acid ABC transporter substrate-binding protein [Rhodospirillales bacterium]